MVTKESDTILQELSYGQFTVQVLADGFRQVMAHLRAGKFDTWGWYQLARRR